MFLFPSSVFALVFSLCLSFPLWDKFSLAVPLHPTTVFFISSWHESIVAPKYTSHSDHRIIISIRVRRGLTDHLVFASKCRNPALDSPHRYPFSICFHHLRNKQFSALQVVLWLKLKEILNMHSIFSLLSALTFNVYELSGTLYLILLDSLTIWKCQL